MEAVTKIFDPQQWAEEWQRLGGRIDYRGRIGWPWNIWLSDELRTPNQTRLRNMLRQLSEDRQKVVTAWVRGEVASRRWF